MSAVHSFNPVLGLAPRALVLGSMPGAASLRAAQYYAHPRNAFWPLMQALFHVPAQTAYSERLARLADAGVALWDVIAECERPGSLDARIALDSVRVNAIAELCVQHPSIDVIALNGTTAAMLFQRHIHAALPKRPFTVLRLPSTSPAHAALSLADKQRAWSSLATALEAVPCA